MPHRQALLDALQPLGTLGNGIYGGDAIYVFARLPPGQQPGPKLTAALDKVSLALGA